MTRKAWTHDSKIRRLSYRGRYDVNRILEMREEGHGYKLIAIDLGVSRDTARELVMRVERLVAHRAEAAERGVELPPFHDPRLPDPDNGDEDGASPG